MQFNGKPGPRTLSFVQSKIFHYTVDTNKKILPPTFSRNHPASTCQWSGRPWRYGKVKEILGMHPGRPSPGRVRVSVASAAIMYHPFYRQKILTTTVQGHLNRLSGINKRHDQEKKQYNTPSTVTAIFCVKLCWV